MMQKGQKHFKALRTPKILKEYKWPFSGPRNYKKNGRNFIGQKDCQNSKLLASYIRYTIFMLH
jgi:hypothetical protein